MIKITKNGILAETLDGEMLFQSRSKNFPNSAEMALRELCGSISMINRDHEMLERGSGIRIKNFKDGDKLILDERGGDWAEKTKNKELKIHQNNKTYRFKNVGLLEQLAEDLMKQKDRLPEKSFRAQIRYIKTAISQSTKETRKEASRGGKEKEYV